LAGFHRASTKVGADTAFSLGLFIPAGLLVALLVHQSLIIIICLAIGGEVFPLVKRHFGVWKMVQK
jgi:hypothetical protein